MRDYESDLIWQNDNSAVKFASLLFQHKFHSVGSPSKACTVLGEAFWGVVPVFGLALHRGIQVKIQRSLGEVSWGSGEKETLQEVPNNGRTSLCMLLVRISTFQLALYVLPYLVPLGILEWSRSWHV